MPVIIPVGTTLEFKSFCKVGSQQGINVSHFVVTAVAGGTMSDQTIVNSMDASVAPLYKAWLPTVGSYLGSRLQAILPAPASVPVISTTGAGAGSVASDPLPPAVSMLGYRKTAFAGRRYRGRLYLPFWCETHNGVNGSPSGGAIATGLNLIQFLNSSIAVVNAGVTLNMKPVLLNRPSGTTTDILTYGTRSEWATQRRRSLINRGDSFGP